MPTTPNKSARYWRTRRNQSLVSVILSLPVTGFNAYYASRTDGALHVFLLFALIMAGHLAGWYGTDMVRYHFRYRARVARDIRWEALGLSVED